MIKKILIGGVCMLSCLTLVGCGNANQEAATTNLATQLDRLNNSVNSISNAGNYSLPELSSLTKDTSSYSDSYNKATQSIKDQESYRNAIKSKVATIKNQLGKDLKLGNQNLKTLRNLTSNLASETTSLNNTKSEYNASLKGVNTAVQGSDVSTVSSKITRLSNCVDARTCYYNNILNTLSQIESILGINNNNNMSYNSLFNNNTNVSGVSTTTNTDTNDNSNITNEALQQLLYNYLLNNLCPGGNCFNNQQNCPNGVCPPNTYNGYANNYGANNSTCPGTTTCPGTVNYPYNNVNSYNGMYNNGIYNNGVNGTVMNPDRNTDSYGPINKNIDTYRPNINGTYENLNGANNFNGTNNFNGANGAYNNGFNNANFGSNNSRPVLNGDATQQNQTETKTENKTDVKLDETIVNNTNNSDNLISNSTKTDSKMNQSTETTNSNSSNTLNQQNNQSSVNQNKTTTTKTDSTTKNSGAATKTADLNRTKPVNNEIRRTMNPTPSKIARPMPKTLQNDVASEEPAKGHTSTASLLDTNKKIEELVRGNLTETFDIQFLFCN